MVTTKLLADVAGPPAVVVTEITPDAAPGITIPTSVVPLLETTIAVTPPMVKAVGLPRSVPVMVTSVPTAPLDGLKEMMVGACAITPKVNVIKNNTITGSHAHRKFFCLTGPGSTHPDFDFIENEMIGELVVYVI